MKLPDKFLRWVVLAILLVLAGQFLVGPTGIVQVWRLHRECAAIENEIVQRKLENDSLSTVIERLNSDPVYIERTARERLGYARPGETVIKFVDRE